MPDNPFEIAQFLRDVSEQNLKQAHAGYEQLVDFVSKAMGAWGRGDAPKCHERRLQGFAKPRHGYRDGKC